MSKKWLINIRIIVALIVFVGSVMAFINACYPLPFFDVQFTAIIQSVLVAPTITAVVLLLMLLGVTLLFGRIYCATLCPLGIYQELLTILFKPFYKKRTEKRTPHSVIGYFSAAILFGTLFGGTVALLRLVDPYSVAGNALSGATYGIAFITVLTILVFFKKRFFCTDICPVGAILGILSRFSLFKIRIESNSCKLCHLCEKVCPTASIDVKNQTVNNETCIRCFKCLTHCHHSAISYGLKEKAPVSFNPSRRKFIINGALLLALGGAFKGGIELSKNIAAKVKKIILPAGAESAEKFANRCLNCNLCVANCPMKIIKKKDNNIPVVHLEYGKSYCKYNCHKCSEVCPSGAIKKISLSEKQHTKIATAFINTDKCIQCGICVRECPGKIITKEKGEFPHIDENKCIGCGLCHSVCPMQAISMVSVEEQKRVD